MTRRPLGPFRHLCARCIRISLSLLLWFVGIGTVVIDGGVVVLVLIVFVFLFVPLPSSSLIFAVIIVTIIIIIIINLSVRVILQ